MIMDRQDEIFLREQVRRVLREKHLITEFDDVGTQELHDVFVAPFKRVFDVFKVAAKDILTSTKFTFDMLVTFDPKKLMDLKANFEARKRKIKGDYKKVMEPYDKLLGGDIGIAAMFLAPQIVIPMKAGSAAMKSAGSLKGFLQDAGFGDPSAEEQEAIGTKEPKGVIRSLVDQLGKLFFGESAIPTGELLTEQVAADSTTGALDDIGMLDDIERGAEELISGLEEDLKNLESEFGPRYAAIRGLRGASDMDGLAKALTDANAAGFELTDLNPAEVKQQMETDVNNMIEDKEKLFDAIPEKKRPAIEKMSDDEIKQELMKIIFVSATDDIRKNTDNLGKQLRETLNNILIEIVPENDIGYLKKTDMGKKYLDILNDFRKKFGLEEV